MSPLAAHLLHQAIFGGVAAAGLASFSTVRLAFLWLGFASGAFALAVRTGAQDIGGLDLPAASFIGGFPSRGVASYPGATGFAARVRSLQSLAVSE
jgi:uncharacterized membrane protein YjjB (DUF3815 family)